MGKVEEISSCIVGMAGSNNNSIPISRLNLSPWDLQLLPSDANKKGILFHKPPHYSSQTLIPHLKTSLSLTLDFFPPLAGRLAAIAHDDGTTSFYIECNNAGAEFVHAVAADTSISDILEPKCIPAELVASFFPLKGVPNYDGVSKPLLAVQLTELADGVFIGCSANHSVVDGISFWHFFNSWSEISRGFHTISKPPIFKPWFPSNVSDDNRLPPIPPRQQMSVPPPPPPPLLEKVIHYSKQTLAKLKATANSEAGTDKISRLQALSAHLWRGVSRSRFSDLSGQESAEAPFTMLLGARSRIPLPEGYFGNAAMYSNMTMSAAELLGKGVGHAAAKINELVAQQTKQAIMKEMEDWVENPAYIRIKEIRFAFIVASSPRHDVYGNDFGWGKPIAVRSAGLKMDGKMTLFPAAESGGIDVEVCLAPETLRAMEDDAEFMEAFI